MKSEDKQIVQTYLKELMNDIEGMLPDVTTSLTRAAETLKKAREQKKNVFFMGNGGSGATASHLVADLGKRKMTIKEKKPRFRAISLTDNMPSILAWANDQSYEDIFVEQLKNLLEEGDVVIGISGSGNSPNVIKAVAYANEQGATTIGFTGYDGGKLKELAQISIHAPCKNMQRSEDIHMILGHVLTCSLQNKENLVC